MLIVGVGHKFPWESLVLARECYDPDDYGSDDDTEEVDEGDGVVVIRRKDWFRYNQLFRMNSDSVVKAPKVETMSLSVEGTARNLYMWRRISTSRSCCSSWMG